MLVRRRAVLLGVCSLSFAIACGRGAGVGGAAAARCAFCGMRIATGSHWQSGCTTRDGRTLVFDTPGCLFRHRFAPPDGAVQASAWVSEYYGAAGTHTDATTVRYVTGSDVVGPMGPDLVPVAASRAEGFAREHHGRAPLGFAEITAATLQQL